MVDRREDEYGHVMYRANLESNTVCYLVFPARDYLRTKQLGVRVCPHNNTHLASQTKNHPSQINHQSDCQFTQRTSDKSNRYYVNTCPSIGVRTVRV